MDTKTCGKCGKTKPLDDFYQSKGVTKSWCKDCSRKYQKELYKKEPHRVIERARNYRERYAEKYAAYRKENRPKAYLYELQNKYGLSKEDAQRLLAENGIHCAICGVAFDEKNKRNLDHCHATGKVRNFLCRRCNSVLGLVNDDGLLLRKFMRYIKEHAQ